MTDTQSDADLAAWWCGNADRYRAESEEDGWRSAFESMLADVREGMPIREALIRNHLPLFAPMLDEGAQRSLVDLEGLAVPAVSIDGDYGCPLSRPCHRVANADRKTGSEPRCELTDRPMRFVSKRPQQ